MSLETLKPQLTAIIEDKIATVDKRLQNICNLLTQQVSYYDWVGFYFANQENINKYAKSNQHQTFLDTSYDKLPQLKIECDWVAPSYAFVPKNPKQLSIDTNLPTYLYTPYHLDPEWRYSTKGNRILFWDLSHWQEYPFTEQNFNWINDLAKLNIPDDL